MVNRFRRLAIRYERRIDLHHAFAALACSLICPEALQGRLRKAMYVAQAPAMDVLWTCSEAVTGGARAAPVLA